MLNNFDASEVFDFILTFLGALGFFLLLTTFSFKFLCNSVFLPLLNQRYHDLSDVVGRWVAISVSTFGKSDEFKNLVYIGFDFDKLKHGVRLVLASGSLFVTQTSDLIYLFDNLVVGGLGDIVLATLTRL